MTRIAAVADRTNPPALPVDRPGPETSLEQYRTELTGYCYRLLGSAFEAEDAVQETLVRAWRGFNRFEGRAQLRSWLYRIARNVCNDMLSARRRRARGMDFRPAPDADRPMFPALPDGGSVEPVSDAFVVPAGEDPADVAIVRESIRLAFVTALQRLTPKQRAVLILREVLRWRANEVAELLETSVPSVNSALQRARATLAATQRDPHDDARVPDELDEDLRRRLARYVDAFERSDVAALTSLLQADAS